ncbi:MAG TPA: hypothetical protein PKB12_02830 [Elusimicrobiota bacterium]|nr:hypothetical protein [Elusimicrobiota bacterium]HMX42630.1 hypothetical protein [Elusimicrobiota bacterium]HMX95523.1 hypothetical protein [Elusimicrobiota bacterium]HNA61426.1 hypothetical protein [Elusimicrobiota bacterium]HNC74549.1 hypothetical protein [Elusimicrobiota bacterium]
MDRFYDIFVHIYALISQNFRWDHSLSEPDPVLAPADSPRYRKRKTLRRG